ncbi:hypothetical protein EVAR_7378_1 [Eumeta japonica]|uniref:Uncharacterized protein n=1 Tax=Eumeta variegata TaxID=151549 RepID=A0A4C1V7M3_EUMVA|nr:hypothetical protein EVAR_7378_1 [Eumeta japonica]
MADGKVPILTQLYFLSRRRLTVTFASQPRFQLKSCHTVPNFHSGPDPTPDLEPGLTLGPRGPLVDSATGYDFYDLCATGKLRGELLAVYRRNEQPPVTFCLAFVGNKKKNYS